MATGSVRIRALSDTERRHMRDVSWKDEPHCPPFDSLALLEVPHWDFDGREQVGEMVVATDVADDVARAFETIFASRFAIERMRRIDFYDADDELSMAANNSSGFCFREIAAGGGLSKHASGHAVDINPVQNPYIIGSSISPAAASAYLDRADLRVGMIVRPSPVVDAFEAIGWEWGGDWTTRSDYHHFARRSPE